MVVFGVGVGIYPGVLVDFDDEMSLRLLPIGNTIASTAVLIRLWCMNAAFIPFSFIQW